MSERILAWYSGIEELNDTAKEKGFEVEDGVGVLAVQKSELLNSPAVKKTLRIEFPGIHSIAFSELWTYQYEDILNYLKKCFVEVPDDYLEELDENLSQIVYDDKDRIRGMILCRTNEEEVLIELLLGSKKASHFIMAALQGFALALEKTAEEDAQITMLAATDTVIPLLKRVLDKKYQYRELGVVHCIRGEADPAFISSLSEAEEECLYQKNIRWKYPWSMKYRGMEQ